MPFFEFISPSCFRSYLRSSDEQNTIYVIPARPVKLGLKPSQTHRHKTTAGKWAGMPFDIAQVTEL